MKKNDVYPSKYISSADIGDNEYKMTIERVVMEELSDDEEKPIAYFKGARKGMVINPTNWDRLALLFGDESNDWHGKTVTLYTEMVNYKGKVTKGLRVKGAGNKTPKTKLPEPDSENPAEGMPGSIAEELDDEIPFN